MVSDATIRLGNMDRFMTDQTLTWSDTFETGDARIDEQHRQLFLMVNLLVDGGPDRPPEEMLPRLLRRLAVYVATHFEEEEELMRSFGYPGLGRHSELHSRLRERVDSLFDEDGAAAPVHGALELATFIAEWLSDHVKGEDKKMIAWVRSRRDID